MPPIPLRHVTQLLVCPKVSMTVTMAPPLLRLVPSTYKCRHAALTMVLQFFAVVHVDRQVACGVAPLSTECILSIQRAKLWSGVHLPACSATRLWACLLQPTVVQRLAVPACTRPKEQGRSCRARGKLGRGRSTPCKSWLMYVRGRRGVSFISGSIGMFNCSPRRALAVSVKVPQVCTGVSHVNQVP
jgi:hypothetical protein